MVKLGSVIIQVRGVSYSPKDLRDSLNDESVILLRANNIQDGKINFDDVVYIDKKKVNQNQYLRRGDILICTSSGSKNLVGKAAYCTENIDVTFGTFCKVIRPSIQYKEFIGHFFNSPYYREKISSLSSGANINNIRNEHIDNLEINLPDENIQGIITQKLNLLNKIIESRKTQLSKLDQLVKSRFIEMFGDPVTNPYDWTISRLENSIEFITSGSRGWSQYFSNDGELFITIKNIKNSKIVLKEIQYINPPKNAEAVRTKVQEGDLLISITADLGRTGVVTKLIAEKGAYINQHLTCIRLNKSRLSPLFVSYFLESPAGKKQFSQKNQTGVKAGLNFEAIKSLQIFIPPLSLQKKFVSFVQQIDKSISIVTQSLEKLETLKKSLMQEYFG